jgi:hypothetical protein
MSMSVSSWLTEVRMPAHEPKTHFVIEYVIERHISELQQCQCCYKSKSCTNPQKKEFRGIKSEKRGAME